MPWGLQRFQHTHQSHFVTFSCYHHKCLFTTEGSRREFETALERVRRRFRLRVYAYVVMPDHVHLLVSEPEVQTLADALKSLKQGVSRRLIGRIAEREPTQAKSRLERATVKHQPTQAKSGLEWATVGIEWGTENSGDPKHLWQKRYYDFNVRNHAQFVEKLKYIHRNPVRAELCARPEDWEWSSFRHYATGCEGRVEIESEWTARKRERQAGKLCAAVELPHSSQEQA